VAKKRSRPAPVTSRGPSGANTTDSAATDRRLWVVAVIVAIVGFTIATYTPVWRFAFVALDDPQYVYANKNLAEGLTAQSISWAMTTGHEANWHPMTWMSHAFDISVFGMNSGCTTPSTCCCTGEHAAAVCGPSTARRDRLA
jgi:hypothetical protein